MFDITCSICGIHEDDTQGKKGRGEERRGKRKENSAVIEIQKQKDKNKKKKKPVYALQVTNKH